MKKSRLLDEMRETARGLERLGGLDKQTMREFDVLTLPPVQELTAKQIRAIRARSRVSQAVFAAMLNTSVSTVQKWEIGEKRPSGPSLKLLNVIQRKGIDAIS
ncbi:MAG TPA: helix-turn-helix domain-containing protein [Steroidobacteraceae bacterium]|nr:helix-turn-helix domain-containing protein [Steroidobacteraceae bacterium]